MISIFLVSFVKDADMLWVTAAPTSALAMIDLERRFFDKSPGSANTVTLSKESGVTSIRLVCQSAKHDDLASVLEALTHNDPSFTRPLKGTSLSQQVNV